MNLAKIPLGLKTAEEQMAWFESLSPDEQNEFQRELSETVERINRGVIAMAAALAPVMQQIYAAAEQVALAMAKQVQSIIDGLPPEMLRRLADPEEVEKIIRKERRKARYERRYARGRRRHRH